MTNLYDAAYDMEKAIRNSAEYAQLRKMYDEVYKDETAKRMFENFRNIQMELQQKQMMGYDITEEEVQHAQKTVALVGQHATIAKLMEAEQRMSMIIGELNRIIMMPLEDLYGPME
ncbi:YlbF family regulator [Bacillus sp. CGMCC 1.16607]|uniref:YlbF family regulator n=1 Tax=Bacillus sp. CGMCC 1.16607 TaxID=3351842 RepID=UPI003645E7F2